MRFFEFNSTDAGKDKFILLLKNEVMTYARQRSRAVLNWPMVADLAKKVGFEFLSDPKSGYETFKSLYDTTPALKAMVKDFNQRGIELNVPGAPDDKKGSGTQDSQSEINKAAASAAPQQVAQAQQTPQI
jgi:hypothetical protein